MLIVDDTVLIVIDMQEKLVAAMHDKDAVVVGNAKIVQGAKILGIPIVWTEQNPKGLGATVSEVAGLLQGSQPVTKLSFSACGEPSFLNEVEGLHRKQALVTGVECHVCVYQTAADLVKKGYEVQVVIDAVSSRTPDNKSLGLEKCKEAGATLTSVETALFELLKVAEGHKFKQMLKVVK